jgi:hypothetical protein
LGAEVGVGPFVLNAPAAGMGVARDTDAGTVVPAALREIGVVETLAEEHPTGLFLTDRDCRDHCHCDGGDKPFEHRDLPTGLV